MKGRQENTRLKLVVVPLELFRIDPCPKPIRKKDRKKAR